MARRYALPADLDAESRLKTGAFYTPDPIVDFMVATVLSGRKFPLSICDYACGGGAFLAGVIRYLKKNFPADFQSYCRNLWGIDINPSAVELARKNLPEIPPENFICADTLNGTIPEKYSFDIIIGNPPYRCGGVRNRESFSAERQKELKKLFPNSFEYKMNLFALFIEQASRLSDEFSLIIPDTLLCGRYLSKLRRYLTENFFIKGLFVVEKPEFDASPGNVVILHTAFSAPGSLTRCCRFKPGEALVQKEFHTIDQRRFLCESRCRFQLTNSLKEEELIAKLFAGSTPLKESFHFASGIISRRGKNSIVTTTPGEYTQPGIIYGREIKPFELSSENFLLDLDPKNIKSGLDHQRFSGEKIFVRQTGSSLIAAVSREKLYSLNNCHVGTAAGNFPLDTLAALLNSTVMNWLYRFLSGEHNRNFAQIDIDLLRELPLKRSPEFDRFAALCADTVSLRRELDARCAELYGLTAEEANYIAHH